MPRLARARLAAISQIGLGSGPECTARVFVLFCFALFRFLLFFFCCRSLQLSPLFLKTQWQVRNASVLFTDNEIVGFSIVWFITFQRVLFEF